MPISETLRTMLVRLNSVRNVSVASEKKTNRTMPAAAIATSRFASSARSGDCGGAMPRRRQARRARARRRAHRRRSRGADPKTGRASIIGGVAGYAAVSMPTIILTISSGVVSVRRRTPTFRPRRKHCDAVGDGEHLPHVMADDDDAVAGRLEVQDQVQDLSRFLHAERGGRLVHDDDAAVLRGRPADGDRLPLAAGKLADLDGQRRDVDFERGDDLARAFEHRLPVDEPAPFHRLAPEIEVRRDVAEIDEREVLINRRDSELARLLRVADLRRLRRRRRSRPCRADARRRGS